MKWTVNTSLFFCGLRLLPLLEEASWVCNSPTSNAPLTICGTVALFTICGTTKSPQRWCDPTQRRCPPGDPNRRRRCIGPTNDALLVPNDHDVQRPHKRRSSSPTDVQRSQKRCSDTALNDDDLHRRQKQCSGAALNDDVPRPQKR